MGGAACGLLPSLAKGERMLTVYTFGDSILDCGHYKRSASYPGRLLVRNDDGCFPSSGAGISRARPAPPGSPRPGWCHGPADLRSPRRGRGPRRWPGAGARDGGGNDLLGGLIVDRGPGVGLRAALDGLPDGLPSGRSCSAPSTTRPSAMTPELPAAPARPRPREPRAGQCRARPARRPLWRAGRPARPLPDG